MCQKLSLENLPLTWLQLTNSLVPSKKKIVAVWVSFVSKKGKRYTAVYVPNHVSGSYILVTSEDKDLKDFKFVVRQISRSHAGQPEKKIADRGNDICQTISVRGINSFFVNTQLLGFFLENFSDCHIAVIHYEKLSDWQFAELKRLRKIAA